MSNVDPVDDMVIRHAGHSSIHMNLADSMGTFCVIVHGIGLECWNHNLVSHNTVVVSSALVFAWVVLVNQGLPFGSKILWVHHNGDRQEHVSLKHQASGGCTTGFMDANLNCTLC